MEGEHLEIFSQTITFLNQFFMSEKTFQTSNRQFGVVLDGELQRHCIPVRAFMKVCRFKHDTFFSIRRA